jgi:hypothetical protein
VCEEASYSGVFEEPLEAVVEVEPVMNGVVNMGLSITPYLLVFFDDQSRRDIVCFDKGDLLSIIATLNIPLISQIITLFFILVLQIHLDLFDDLFSHLWVVQHVLHCCDRTEELCELTVWVSKVLVAHLVCCKETRKMFILVLRNLRMSLSKFFNSIDLVLEFVEEEKPMFGRKFKLQVFIDKSDVLSSSYLEFFFIKIVHFKSIS